MSIYTNTTRITGLSSGMDIDSLVDQLITAESTKYNRYQQNIQTLQWQQEAYRTIIDKVEEFQEKYFASTSSDTNLRYSKALTNYKSSVTTQDGIETSAVKVTGTTSAGTYTLKVDSAATKSVLKSDYNSFSYRSAITGEKTLEEIEQSVKALGDDETVGFTISYDGKGKEIKISKSDLTDEDGNAKDIGTVINEKLQRAFGTNSGVANVKLASTDKTEKISLVTSGDGHTLKISSGTVADDSFAGELSDNFSDSKLSKDVSSLKFTVNLTDKDGNTISREVNVDLSVGEDDDPLTASKVSSKINSALSEIVVDAGDSDDDSDDVKLNSIISFSYSSSKGFVIDNKSLDYDFSISDTGNLSNITDVSELGADRTFTAATTLNTFGFDPDTSMSYVNVSKETVQDVLGADEDLTLNINGKTITIDHDGTFQNMIDAINNSGAGVKLSYSTITNNFTLESTSTGSASGISFGDEDTENFFKSLGLDISGTDSDGNAYYTEGTDAVVTINGVKTTRASNTISLDGVTVEISGETEELTITAENDTDKTYELIKSFVDDYNTLIEELNSVVKESRTKYDDYTYYDPLTDAQKEEMDDDEIEKWETEAKKGILKNDTYISGLLSGMRSLLYTSVTLQDGTKTALYKFGITTTSDTSKGGMLEIDEDKFKEAIADNGIDNLKELFTQTSTGIGDKMKTQIESYVGTSGLIRLKAGKEGTVTQNENILSNQISALQNKMSDEKTRLAEKETYYYEMFSKMESAISQNNTEMDYVLSMLGS